MLLLRGMNPQVLAMDEITTAEDIEALSHAMGCGATLLATAHGDGVEDLTRRPVYRAMTEAGIFRKVVLIHRVNGIRYYRVETLQ